MRMYSEYFGIQENAFTITPDPRYLFMSERHREALAHLLFGTEEGGGFVQITGEVGTGKTTVCRAFLEQLPESVDVALLLSPPDNARELLLAITSELRLRLPRRNQSPGELIALLNRHLLESHATGRRTVVIIDEAQNILPDVLEQLRLLTNLETPTHKLLQIFLIGQPELRQKLQHPSLRQVAQRITARYHLEPLNLWETQGYIRHRLSVAGCSQELFSAAAIRQIHRHSQGIPRVINILCDRALIGAYATESTEVTPAIVRHAVREWRGEESGSRWYGLPNIRPAFVVTMAALFIASTAGFVIGGVVSPGEQWMRMGLLTESVPSSLKDRVTGRPALAGTPVSAMADEIPRLASAASATEDKGFPTDHVLQKGVPVALHALLARWGVAGEAADRLALCTQASHHGLQCLRGTGGWDELRGYNRPALLTLQHQQGHEAYLALVGMDSEHALVATSEGVMPIALRELSAHWRGEYMLLWQPPLDGVAMIAPGANAESVRWLIKALHSVDGVDSVTGVFDSSLEKRLRVFQRSHGLTVDGIAGPRTLIRLNNVLAQQQVPLLLAENRND